jgi:RNA polymerase sigma-70 factor (ECF subfamily)
MAGAATVSDLATAIGMHVEESSIVAELKAGSEDAYAWLIAQFHQPVYSLVYRILDDPMDAPDTTQEVFIKVFRGVKRFHGESSLKTWIYRIAIHEASNRRRWFFRHKAKESSMERRDDGNGTSLLGYSETLVDDTPSPFEEVMHEEVRAKVEDELKKLAEPYRTTVILRDIEELSYEQIAEVMETSLGNCASGWNAMRENWVESWDWITEGKDGDLPVLPRQCPVPSKSRSNHEVH